MPDESPKQRNTGGEKPSRIERLQRELYRRDVVIPEPVRHELPEDRKQDEASRDWERSEEVPSSPSERMTLLKKVLLISGLFFIGSVAFAAFLFLRGGTTVSSENIDIAINGPVSVGGGEELALQVLISNSNPVALELADFIVQFPPGTRDPANRSKPLTRIRESAGSIPAGGVANRTVRAVLFGEENSEQELVFSLEYRIAGSNAIFIKEKRFTIPLTAAPVTLGVELPEEASSDEAIEAIITVRSNTEAVQDNVLLEVLYPSGFVFAGASPVPSPESNRLWRLGDLAPGSQRVIRIRGAITGQHDELKTFTVTVGAPAPAASNAISIPYNSTQKTLALKRPSVGAGIVLNGSLEGDVSVSRGESVNGTVVISNNLPVRILDAKAALRFEGDILDRTSVNPIAGFFRSTDSVIVWEGGGDDWNGTLEPGETKEFRFNFQTLSQVVPGKDTSLRLVLGVAGTRVVPSGDRSVEAEVSRTINLATEVGLSARALYRDGPFQNTGPLPPVADTETTYTIVWAVANSINDLRDGAVTAVLPQYIRWRGEVSPSGDTVLFDERSHTVTWKAGTVPAGTGTTRPAREVAFRIGFVPSLSQVGETPTLVRESVLSGIDDVLGLRVEARRGPLTTLLVTDRGFRDGDGTVIGK